MHRRGAEALGIDEDFEKVKLLILMQSQVAISL